jgi:uncharacterized cofD-like protein
MQLRPKPPQVSDEIRGHIGEADLVVIGPGSLFTSLVPNLLVPGMPEAIAACPGRVVLVANVMTQPGETDGFSLADHVRMLRAVGGLGRLDLVLASTTPVPAEVAARYRAAGAELIDVASAGAAIDGTPVETDDMTIITEEGRIRHHPGRLAEALSRLIAKAPAPEVQGG